MSKGGLDVGALNANVGGAQILMLPVLLCHRIHGFPYGARHDFVPRQEACMVSSCERSNDACMLIPFKV